MLTKGILLVAALTGLISGCSTIASSTNMLSDDRIKAETSAALGLRPSEVTIVSRRTEGSTTVVNLVSPKKQQYTCMIDGGDLLTLGMSNAPQCSKKGEMISAKPLLR